MPTLSNDVILISLFGCDSVSCIDVDSLFSSTFVCFAVVGLLQFGFSIQCRRARDPEGWHLRPRVPERSPSTTKMLLCDQRIYVIVLLPCLMGFKLEALRGLRNSLSENNPSRHSIDLLRGRGAQTGRDGRSALSKRGRDHPATSHTDIGTV